MLLRCAFITHFNGPLSDPELDEIAKNWEQDIRNAGQPEPGEGGEGVEEEATGEEEKGMEEEGEEEEGMEEEGEEEEGMEEEGEWDENGVLRESGMHFFARD